MPRPTFETVTPGGIPPHDTTSTTASPSPRRAERTTNAVAQIACQANFHHHDEPTTRAIKPLPSRRRASVSQISLAASSRREERQLQKGSRSISAGASPGNQHTQLPGEGVESLFRTVGSVVKVHPSIDPGFLFDLVQRHYTQCTPGHIVACTLEHLARHPNYPKNQSNKQSGKRKLSEAEVDMDTPSWPPKGSATRRRLNLDGVSTLSRLLPIPSYTRPVPRQHPERSFARERDNASVGCESCAAQCHPSSVADCPAGHLFCHPCVFKSILAQVDSQDPVITCLQPSCPHPFSKFVLLKIVPHEPVGRYDRLIQNHHFKQIRTLEECPRCHWSCTIKASIDQVKWFHCGNTQICGSVSCRVCKRPPHGSMSCKDAEAGMRRSSRSSFDDANLQIPSIPARDAGKAFETGRIFNGIDPPNSGSSKLGALVSLNMVVEERLPSIAEALVSTRATSSPPRPSLPPLGTIHLDSGLPDPGTVNLSSMGFPSPNSVPFVFRPAGFNPPKIWRFRDGNTTFRRIESQRFHVLPRPPSILFTGHSR